MYPGPISIARVLAYAYMSGSNDQKINAEGFRKGVTLFGLDCPVPSVTKRLAFYGNTQDVLN
jgi:hypothetical protein